MLSAPHTGSVPRRKTTRCSKPGRTAFGLVGVFLASDDERVERANRARFSSSSPSAVFVAGFVRRVARDTRPRARWLTSFHPRPNAARKSARKLARSTRRLPSRGNAGLDAFLSRGAPASDSFERRARATTKPLVPKATERPLMGLTTTKNFVAANAIENILAKPPARREPAPATAKKDYGRVPEYLRAIKAQIAAEKAQMEECERERQDSTRGSARRMTEEERDQLLCELEMKLAKLNEAYGKLSFSLDVPSRRRQKESLEKEMTQLEKDIKTLQGKEVVVVEEHASHGRA